MDCRRTLLPAVWLLGGALGCAGDPRAAPVRETPPPPLAGDWAAGEARARPKGSTEQEQMRDTARKSFQQAMTINPTYLPAYRSLAKLYVEMDDYEHAVATYHKALRLQPRNGALWFDLGMCHARYKAWPAALDALNRAHDCDPENRQYLNTLGHALARTGRYQDSLNCFVRSYGNEAMAHYQLARMLHHLGQNDQARQCLQAALQRDPNLEPAAPPSRELLREGIAPQPSAARVILPPPPSSGNWQTGPDE